MDISTITHAVGPVFDAFAPVIVPVVQTAVQTLGVPAAIALAWQGLQHWKSSSAGRTYAEALLRAVGAGQAAASAQGMSIFSPKGKEIAARAGAEYLMNTVPAAAAAKGITDIQQHVERVTAQIGALEAQAIAAGVLQAPDAVANLGAAIKQAA